MLSRPSLMPNCSSAKSRSTRSQCAERWRHRGMKRSARAMRRLQLAPVDDQVEHAALEQELAALEAVGQLLADGLLDDARPGEADQRLRLGDVEVAQHREARRHAAGRRIGEDRDVGQAGAIEPRQRRRDLRHLHQRQRAFHHARAARARHDDQRQRGASSAVSMPRDDLLAHHDAHAAADEARTPSPRRRPRCRRSGRRRRSRRPAGRWLLRSRPSAIAVRLGVGEVQRVVRAQVRRRARPTARRRTASAAARAAVSRKWWAHLVQTLQALDEVLGVDDRVALGTLDPQAFGHAAGLVRRGNRLARLLEPGHRGSLTDSNAFSSSRANATFAARSTASPCPCR